MDNTEKDRGGEYYCRWLEGEEEALGLVIALYRKNLICFVNRYLNNPAQSEEVAIDTFAELILHKRSYDFRFSLKTYLYTIAKNKALNVLRQRKHLSDEPLPENFSDYQSLEDSVIAQDRRRVLYEAVKELPQAAAEAVYLYYFEELSYAECAKVMNVKQKRVDNLLQNSKKRLRGLLEKEGLHE